MSPDKDEKLRIDDVVVFIYREIVHVLIFYGNYLYEKLINVVDVSRHLQVFGIVVDNFVVLYLENIKESLLNNRVKFMHTYGCFDEYILVEIGDIHVGEFGREKGLGRIAVAKKCPVTLGEYNEIVKSLENCDYFVFKTKI